MKSAGFNKQQSKSSHSFALFLSFLPKKNLDGIQMVLMDAIYIL